MTPLTSRNRLSGVDAARGVALFGMMAIHVLPPVSEDYQPTLVWDLFAGKAAALFALLAGVSLAFITRKAWVERGSLLTAARWSVAARAGLIMSLGLVIAYVDMPAFIILAYYGAMFLLAVPLLGASTRTLVVAAAAFGVLGPLLMQALRDYLPEPGYDPTVTTVLTEPVMFITQLLLTGTYPALPWMAYICAGLIIGRLGLERSKVHVMLVGTGTALAFGSWLLSDLLLYGPADGFGQLLTAEQGPGSEDVGAALIWGPEGYLPTSSWWWLTIIAPHSSTPFDILHTIGVAVAALGVMLLLARYCGKALLPISAAGRMTLTFYCAHLLFLGTGAMADRPYLSLSLQIAVVITVALIWQRRGSRGPLEIMVSRGSGGVRDAVLRRTLDSGKA